MGPRTASGQFLPHLENMCLADGRTDGWTERWTDRRMDGRMDGRTDGRTDGKSPHSTGLRPLSEPLPKNILAGKSDSYNVIFSMEPLVHG